MAGDPFDRDQLQVGRALDDHGDAGEHRDRRAALDDLEPALRQDVSFLRDPAAVHLPPDPLRPDDHGDAVGHVDLRGRAGDDGTGAGTGAFRGPGDRSAATSPIASRAASVQPTVAEDIQSLPGESATSGPPNPAPNGPSPSGPSGEADRGLAGIDEPLGMSAGPEPES